MLERFRWLVRSATQRSRDRPDRPTGRTHPPSTNGRASKSTGQGGRVTLLWGATRHAGGQCQCAPMTPDGPFSGNPRTGRIRPRQPDPETHNGAPGWTAEARTSIARRTRQSHRDSLQSVARAFRKYKPLVGHGVVGGQHVFGIMLTAQDRGDLMRQVQPGWGSGRSDCGGQRDVQRPR
jgi:hypothetical protein